MKIAKIILILLILSNTNIFGVVTRNYSQERAFIITELMTE